MTRRKWNKLRRQYPHLFRVLPAFECWDDSERDLMRRVSKKEAMSVMTAWKLGIEPSWPIIVDDGPAWDHLRLTNLTSRR